MSKKIKKGKRPKQKALVRSVIDVLPIAWRADVPCPPPEMVAKNPTMEELQREFPHLMMLFFLHQGRQKSAALIKHNAEILADIEADDLVKMELDDLIAAGLDVPQALIDAATEEVDVEALNAEEQKKLEELQDEAKALQIGKQYAATLPRTVKPTTLRG